MGHSPPFKSSVKIWLQFIWADKWKCKYWADVCLEGGSCVGECVSPVSSKRCVLDWEGLFRGCSLSSIGAVLSVPVCSWLLSPRPYPFLRHCCCCTGRITFSQAFFVFLSNYSQVIWCPFSKKPNPNCHFVKGCSSAGYLCVWSKSETAQSISVWFLQMHLRNVRQGASGL